MQKYEINGRVFVAKQSIEVTDEFHLGSPVRILVKEYSEFKAYTGTIIAIDQFKNRPAVTVCYLKPSYSSPELAFKTITQEEKDVEITRLGDLDETLSTDTIIATMDNKVLAKKAELETLTRQREMLAEALKKITG